MSENIEIIESTTAEAVDKKHVAQTEEMIELDFPASWIEFLSENNGGVPEQNIFPVGDEEKVLQFFLCVDADYKTSETGETDVGVVWSQIEDRLNEYLIPFASVFAGDFLCFDYEGEEDELLETPRIVLWNHDLSEEDEPVTEFVADDFESFLETLKSESDS